MRKLVFVVALLATLLSTSAEASAVVRTGGIGDKLGDSPITLGGDRLADVARVDARYDEQAGKVSVSFTLAEALPYYYSANVYASIAQTDSEGTCQALTRTGDIELSGYFYRSSYNGYTSWSVSADGVGIASSAGYAEMSGDRKTLTITAQGAPIANLDYRCVTGLSHTEWADTYGSDEVPQFFFDDVKPSPRVQPGLITIPGAPSLNRTSFRRGDRVSAFVRYRNAGGGPFTIRQGVITARRPGATHASGPFDNFGNIQRNKTIAGGDDLDQTGPFVIPDDAPAGRWEVYGTWQDAGGVWHDGPSAFFTVVVPGAPATGNDTGGAPTGGSPTGSSARPLAAIGRRPVRLRGRTASVRVTCPGADTESYTGVVRLRSAKKVRGAIIQLGSRSIACDGRERLGVAIRLSRRNARLLRRLGRLRVQAIAVLRDDSGRAGRSSAVFTLKVR